MLRKRARPVTSSNQTAPSSEKSQKPISFPFNSPRIFKDFFSSNEKSSEEQSIMSPSSVLDTKHFSSAKDPQKHQHSWEQPGIGLALIGDHRDERVPQLGPTTTIAKISKQKSKLIVFGSQLKIQIPEPANSLFLSTSPQSPIEFGIKTPKSSLKGVFGKTTQIQKDCTWSQSKDMVLSEDYTCVISHGPNPKTTHIFGNRIVAKNGISAELREKSERSFSSQRDGDFPASGYFSFLSFCHHCKKKIGQGKDIYMYRGERAFCSEECRGQGMLFDEIES